MFYAASVGGEPELLPVWGRVRTPSPSIYAKALGLAGAAFLTACANTPPPMPDMTGIKYEIHVLESDEYYTKRLEHGTALDPVWGLRRSGGFFYWENGVCNIVVHTRFPDTDACTLVHEAWHCKLGYWHAGENSDCDPQGNTVP